MVLLEKYVGTEYFLNPTYCSIKLPYHVLLQNQISFRYHLSQLSSLGDWRRVSVEGKSLKCRMLDKLKLK